MLPAKPWLINLFPGCAPGRAVLGTPSTACGWLEGRQRDCRDQAGRTAMAFKLGMLQVSPRGEALVPDQKGLEEL